MISSRLALVLFLAPVSGTAADRIAWVTPARAQVLQTPDVNYGAGRLSARQARQHVGTQATVCGLVTNVTEAVTNQDLASGRPNIMNIGEPNPARPDLLVVISQADIQRFPSSSVGRLTRFFGKTVCVTGVIGTEFNAPTIIVHGPEAIAIQ
jgi:hypothetical protein